MRKPYGILILAGVVGACCAGLLAQERIPGSRIFAVSRQARENLKTGRAVAIFLTGNDILFTTIVEDAIDIHLMNAGFDVVNRDRLEKTVGEHVDKKKKEKAEGVAINALEIGKALNTAFIVTGAVVVEEGEQKSLVVKIGSLQLVDVPTEKTLINVLFEPEKGKSISDTAREFVEIVKQNM